MSTRINIQLIIGSIAAKKRRIIADHFARARKIRDYANDLLFQVYGIDRLVLNVEEEGRHVEPLERGEGGRYSSTIVVR